MRASSLLHPSVQVNHSHGEPHTALVSCWGRAEASALAGRDVTSLVTIGMAQAPEETEEGHKTWGHKHPPIGAEGMPLLSPAQCLGVGAHWLWG